MLLHFIEHNDYTRLLSRANDSLQNLQKNVKRRLADYFLTYTFGQRYGFGNLKEYWILPLGIFVELSFDHRISRSSTE